MCGRGVQKDTASQKLKNMREFGLTREEVIDGPSLPSRYNIAPTDQLVVVRQGATGVETVPMRWGLVPYWWKDPEKLPASTFNARGDTVLEKASYKVPFKRRRCLIAMDGWYEWKKLSAATKQPYYIHPKDPEGIFVFAGLWDAWKGPEGVLESCTMMTTDANDLVGEIHEKKRMPVILQEEDFKAWLDPSQKDVERLQRLLVPCDSKGMDAYPVHSLQGDGPNLIAPL